MGFTARNEERAFIIECLKVYKSLPALWDTKSPEYRKKAKKDEAYQVLVKKFREKYENINRKDVTKKINTLRTNFRKELKRLAQEGHEDSKVWYFDYMKFLKDQTATKEEESFQIAYDEGESLSIEIIEQPSSPASEKYIRENISESVVQVNNAQPSSSGVLGEYERKLAETWAMELLKMTPEQQIYAKKAINDIIYEGQLGNLYRGSVRISMPITRLA